MSLRLPQRLKHDNAVAVQAGLLALLEPGQDQAVSIHQLHDFDSSALAVMLALKRAALAQGGDVHWQGTPDRMVSLAQIYGVDALLSLHP